MKLEFHPEAELELIEAAAYYELRVPGLGERFEAEVRRATDLLLQHPEIGPAADPVLRKLVLNRFPLRSITALHPTFSASKSSHTRADAPATGGRKLTANEPMRRTASRPAAACFSAAADGDDRGMRHE